MNIGHNLDEKYLRKKYSVAKLLAPTGGILSGITRLCGEHTAPDFEIAVSNIDNMTHTFSHITQPDGMDALNEPMGGAGADVDVELAWIRAAMEGAERYANMAYHESDFIIAAANDLPNAMDLDTVPRCSETEYANPYCPYRPADKSLPIRWSRAFSLTEKREMFVPSVMAHLYLKPGVSEAFWQEISTGCAAHYSLEKALVSAICEVIERDAIAMTWLAKLPLPQIEITQPCPPELDKNLQILAKGRVRQTFYDATTDLGIPIVYSIQTLEEHPTVAQYVNCAVSFNAAECCAKTIREAAPARAVLCHVDDTPADTEDFRSLYDGAAHLGNPNYRDEFEFLLNTPNRTTLDAMKIEAPEDDKGQLNFLLDRIKSHDMDVFAVDLTTQEQRALGIWVVRVIIPQLMPMSTVQRGRFLGHKRLYEYPEKAGFGSLSEADINPTPQPFA
ncbi:YcaO-like family protein [Pseudoalteromonas rubra]|uniref:YcaO-like family protein n=1 Tax=Pseudoalteromonas rubra TaxID=43658 RepID=UPI000698F783|nr:YcaO-like family protein [Pseudoalteromonas rubra]